MSQIFHQSVEDILKAATPEQRLLWNYIFLRWGERVPIAQYCYQGALATADFSTYNANRIYIAYEIEAGTNAVTPQAGLFYVSLYNEANAIFQVLSNNALYWDATAAASRTYPNSIRSGNVWFSRITIATGIYIKFIGYRIGI